MKKWHKIGFVIFLAILVVVGVHVLLSSASIGLLFNYNFSELNSSSQSAYTSSVSVNGVEKYTVTSYPKDDIVMVHDPNEKLVTYSNKTLTASLNYTHAGRTVEIQNSSYGLNSGILTKPTGLEHWTSVEMDNDYFCFFGDVGQEACVKSIRIIDNHPVVAYTYKSYNSTTSSYDVHKLFVDYFSGNPVRLTKTYNATTKVIDITSPLYDKQDIDIPQKEFSDAPFAVERVNNTLTRVWIQGGINSQVGAVEAKLQTRNSAVSTTLFRDKNPISPVILEYSSTSEDVQVVRPSLRTTDVVVSEEKSAEPFSVQLNFPTINSYSKTVDAPEKSGEVRIQDTASVEIDWRVINGTRGTYLLNISSRYGSPVYLSYQSDYGNRHSGFVTDGTYVLRRLSDTTIQVGAVVGTNGQPLNSQFGIVNPRTVQTVSLAASGNTSIQSSKPFVVKEQSVSGSSITSMLQYTTIRNISASRYSPR